MITIYCLCKSDYQDKAYGKGQRVWTPVNGSDPRPKRFTRVRCTVCGREMDAPRGSQPKDDKEEKKIKVETKTTEKAETKSRKRENKETKRR